MTDEQRNNLTSFALGFVNGGLCVVMLWRAFG